MELGKLISGLETLAVYGDLSLEVSGIEIDSKKMQKNRLFICLSGGNHDSHESAREAERYGAGAIVCERRLNVGVPQIVVKDSRRAMSYLSAAFYGFPARRMKIVGITGTNGKTTTARLVKDILERSGKKTGMIGTLGVFFGNTFYEPTLTTPDPPDLHKILSEMYEYGIDYVVMEVSAHAIELQKVADVNFAAGVLTNLTQDHLDYFGTMDRYRAAKKKFLTSGQCERVVVNSDDPLGREILKENEKAVSYGIDNPADVFAIDAEEEIDGTKFVLNLFDDIFEIKLRLLGRFNVYNAMAAAVASTLLGVKPKAAAKALGESEVVPGRMECVSGRGGVYVFVDYAHTPDGLENSLQTLKKVAKNRLICVFGCGGNRDAGKRAQMGEIAGKLADFTVLTSDNPRYEEPMEIIREIEKGLLKKSREYVVIQSREDALRYALAAAKKGDCVLVAGKGCEKYQEILGIKHLYNDKDCIEKIYRERNR